MAVYTGWDFKIALMIFHLFSKKHFKDIEINSTISDESTPAFNTVAQCGQKNPLCRCVECLVCVGWFGKTSLSSR